MKCPLCHGRGTVFSPTTKCRVKCMTCHGRGEASDKYPENFRDHGQRENFDENRAHRPRYDGYDPRSPSEIDSLFDEMRE